MPLLTHTDRAWIKAQFYPERLCWVIPLTMITATFAAALTLNDKPDRISDYFTNGAVFFFSLSFIGAWFYPWLESEHFSTLPLSFHRTTLLQITFQSVFPLAACLLACLMFLNIIESITSVLCRLALASASGAVFAIAFAAVASFVSSKTRDNREETLAKMGLCFIITTFPFNNLPIWLRVAIFTLFVLIVLKIEWRTTDRPKSMHIDTALGHTCAGKHITYLTLLSLLTLVLWSASLVTTQSQIPTLNRWSSILLLLTACSGLMYLLTGKFELGHTPSMDEPNCFAFSRTLPIHRSTALKTHIRNCYIAVLLTLLGSVIVGHVLLHFFMAPETQFIPWPILFMLFNCFCFSVILFACISSIEKGQEKVYTVPIIIVLFGAVFFAFIIHRVLGYWGSSATMGVLGFIACQLTPQLDWNRDV